MEDRPKKSFQGWLEGFNSLTIRTQLIILLSPLLLLAAYIVGKVLVNEYRHLMPNLFYFTKITILGGVLTFGITPLISFLARKYNIVDPSGLKKLENGPIPLLGGTSIYVSFLIVLALFQPWNHEIVAILVGSTIIYVMGTVDDIMKLSSRIRLLGQVAAIAIVLSSGLVISFMPDTPAGTVIAYVITVFWIVGITNALNFMDGADGLAAGIAAIASFFFFLIELHLGHYKVCLIAAILGGCCLGYLYHNFKPAKTYLGDGGSTFIGFVLACIALYGEWSEKGHVVALGIPVLILGVLIFDMIYITISRVKNGNVRNLKEWLDYVGQDHFHHRLIHLGFKEEHAVIFIYVICAILGISALVLEKSQLDYHVVILSAQAFLLFVSITMLMLIGRQDKKTKRK